MGVQEWEVLYCAEPADNDIKLRLKSGLCKQ